MCKVAQTTHFFRNTDRVVPPSIRQVVPAIQVREAGIRPIPEISTLTSSPTFFLRGKPLFCYAKFTPTGLGNADREVPPSMRQAAPAIQEREAGSRPIPEIPTRQMFSKSSSCSSPIISVSSSY